MKLQSVIKSVEEIGDCWICGKKGVNRTRVRVGYQEPFHFSPWINFCESDHCLLEFADFASAVAKDFRAIVKNRRQAEARRRSKA